jgi:hypothetical protein
MHVHLQLFQDVAITTIDEKMLWAQSNLKATNIIKTLLTTVPYL